MEKNGEGNVNTVTLKLADNDVIMLDSLVGDRYTSRSEAGRSILRSGLSNIYPLDAKTLVKRLQSDLENVQNDLKKLEKHLENDEKRPD